MLLLPEALRARMLAEARAAAPREACGVLGGRDGAAGREAVVLHAMRNASAQPDRAYLADPRDQLAAFLAIEDAGLDVVGLWHSHPRGPPEPSPADAALAAYAGLTHVLVWLAPAEGWGAWRWQPPRFEPEGIRVLRA